MPQLLGWRPAGIEAAGSRLITKASAVQRAAGELTGVGTSLSAGWSGAAADAATSHVARRVREVDVLAELLFAAGRALLRAGSEVGQAQRLLQSALAAAASAGCTVSADGSVTPPPPPELPGGLTGEPLGRWQREATLLVQDQASHAGRLAGLIDAALDAAGLADDATAAALSSVVKPTLSPAPQPVVVVPGGDGGWGGQGAPLPSCPVGQPAPAPEKDEDEHGWAYNAFGGFGSAMYKIAPGAAGDAIGLLPWDRAQAVDDWTDRGYDALSDGYGADTDSGAYRVTEVGTQAVGFVATGGVGAIRAIPTAVRAIPAGVRAASGAVRAVPNALRAVPGVARGGVSAAHSLAAALGQVRVISVVTPDGLRIPVSLDLGSVGVLMAKAKEPLSAALQKSKDLLGGKQAPLNGQAYAGRTLDMPTEALRAKYPEGVRFTEGGWPDFSPYAVQEVTPLALTGNRRRDERIANALAGLKVTPKHLVWHHTENVPTMQLIPRDLHERVAHTGGYAIDQAARRAGG